MRALLLFVFIFPSFVLGTEEYKTQIFEKHNTVIDNSVDLEDRRYRFKSLKISDANCAKLKAKRKIMDEHRGAPEFKALLAEVLVLTPMCYMDVNASDSDKLVGFKFANESKNEINSQTEEFESSRQFIFRFDERDPRALSIAITDDSNLKGRMSHDLLETTIILIPRVVYPYITSKLNTGKTIDIVLPTNETMKLDAKTKEIISCPLVESKIDMTASRHERTFVGLKYTGNGIMIRVDRRAGTPEHIYDVSYNKNENIKKAIVTHKGKKCLVPKELIWENAHNADKATYLKHASDGDFLKEVINPVCKWELTMADIK